jgi:CSLREA domain-containing protein
MGMSGVRNLLEVRTVHLMAALTLVLLVGVLLAKPAQAATITVNSTGDATDSDGCTTDSGGCTLREAINAANASTGVVDTINFDLGSPATITLASQLPVITDSARVIIDGAGASITVSGNGSVRVFEVASGAKLTVTKLTVANGRSSPSCSFCDYFGSGGGFYNAGALTVRDSTLYDNGASANDSSSGGAIYNTDSGTLTVSNSTLSRNRARCGGGGIYNAGTLTVSNSTLSDNYAVICEGGGGVSNSGLNSTATLKNTIVANSSLGGNCAGTIANGGHNLDSGTSCGFATENNSLSSTDPLLGALADNGGPTMTYALLEGSPAIDKGNSFGATADQRGVSRPQGAASDIGSFEVEVADTTAPKVNRVVPAENATGVGPATNVRAYFSEAMRSGSVNTNTVKLYKAGSTTARPAAVSYDAATKQAVLNPDANLQPGARYKAVVTVGARDLAGNQLDQDQSLMGLQPKAWFFTVRN